MIYFGIKMDPELKNTLLIDREFLNNIDLSENDKTFDTFSNVSGLFMTVTKFSELLSILSINDLKLFEQYKICRKLLFHDNVSELDVNGYVSVNFDNVLSIFVKNAMKVVLMCILRDNDGDDCVGCIAYKYDRCEICGRVCKSCWIPLLICHDMSMTDDDPFAVHLRQRYMADVDSLYKIDRYYLRICLCCYCWNVIDDVRYVYVKARWSENKPMAVVDESEADFIDDVDGETDRSRMCCNLDRYDVV